MNIWSNTIYQNLTTNIYLGGKYVGKKSKKKKKQNAWFKSIKNKQISWPFVSIVSTVGHNQYLVHNTNYLKLWLTFYNKLLVSKKYIVA